MLNLEQFTDLLKELLQVSLEMLEELKAIRQLLEQQDEQEWVRDDHSYTVTVGDGDVVWSGDWEREWEDV